MNKAETFRKEIADLHPRVLEAIKVELKRIKGIIDADNKLNDMDEYEDEIRFQNPVMYAFIDEQSCETIGCINIDGENSTIDTGDSDYNIKTSDISTAILIEMLDQLEDLETLEDIEKQMM